MLLERKGRKMTKMVDGAKVASSKDQENKVSLEELAKKNKNSGGGCKC